MEAEQTKVATSVYREAVTRQKRDQLVLDHLEYVKQICGTLARRLPEWVDIQNLQSAGVVGLIEAAQSFDEARGVAFKTFSYPRIRGAIIDEIRRNSPLSQKVMKTIARIREAIESIDTLATPELIAEKTGMTVEEVEEGLAASRMISPLPWDQISESEHQADSPDSQIEHRERVSLLADAIEKLPDRDRSVVQMYYLEELRLKEIGVILGVSESRVSRILSRAELRLREALRQPD